GGAGKSTVIGIDLDRGRAACPPASLREARIVTKRVPLGELVGQSGMATKGFTSMRGPGLLPEGRVFPAFSQGFTALAGCRESKPGLQISGHVFSELKTAAVALCFPRE